MTRNGRFPAHFEDDPLWYKDAIIYEVHVRAFQDSGADGIGDFRGLASRLDYLQDLGVTALWLLPFYPSPLRDDGYDIADYNQIHPNYGTLRDFRAFLQAAHARGLRVITELVINHTSDQHPWFQRARRAPKGSRYRNFYVWSDTTERYKEARVIFKDFETSNWTWDPVAGQYYWHRFYSHQPDLNYDNPAVVRAVSRVKDFWFAMGVDGMRLDAIPYLFQREGTSCENLPETHQLLKALRADLDRKFKNRMFLAEANQWPEDAVAYFGDGDECHMAFHFPIMPRLFMALRMEDRFPIIEIMEQTPPIPENCQWALFLRNHDELTLEMVTDADRDYMYRVYAQDPRARINLGIRRRLAPLLGNHRRRIELMNGLLFSLPGAPVIYYGDEIGMGDNIYLGDRNGVRTPMQWSPDRNAGFSRANPQQLYLPVITDPEYHYEAVNVETQQNNPHSLLWWMKRLISLRKRHRAFSRGTLQFLHPDNHRVLAFLRQLGDDTILVLANLSRFVQYVELDLSAFRGRAPVELFGGAALPVIGEGPYPLTLGPHAFYWLSLAPRPAAVAIPAGTTEPMTLAVGADPTTLWTPERRRMLLEAMQQFATRHPRFNSAARPLRLCTLEEVIPLPNGAPSPDGMLALALARLEYTEGESETHLFPLAVAMGESARRLRAEASERVIAHLSGGPDEAVLYDARGLPTLQTALIELIARRRRLAGQRGDLIGQPEPGLRRRASDGERAGLQLTLYQRIEPGLHPAWELGRYLAARHDAGVLPPLGGLFYQVADVERTLLGIVYPVEQTLADGRTRIIESIRRFLENAVAEPLAGHAEHWRRPDVPLVLAATRPLPEAVHDQLLDFLPALETLGERVARFHLVLANEQEDPQRFPEGLTPVYQQAFVQGLRARARRLEHLLRSRRDKLPAPARPLAEQYLARLAELNPRLAAARGLPATGQIQRIHGNLRLQSVLFTGKDWLLTGLEGDEDKSLTERALKRPALADVATLLVDLAACVRMASRVEDGTGSVRPEDVDTSLIAARYWGYWAGVAFLRAYFATAGAAPYLPVGVEAQQAWLEALCLERLLEDALRAVMRIATAAPDALQALLDGLGGLL